MSVILYKVFCMLAGKILWHWWATTKPTTSYSISKYFTIMLCTIYYKWGYSLTIKKNYDLCCATGYDPWTNWIVNVLFTWLWCVYTAGPKAVVIFYSFKFFFRSLVLICTSDHMDLHNFLFCSKVVGNSFEHLSVLNIF